MAKEYYLNDDAWAYCTNGTSPNKMKVVNKLRTVNNKGLILLNEEDRYYPFACKMMILIMAALAAFVATLSFLAALIIGFLLGIGVCAIFTYKSKWINFYSSVIVEGKPAITTKSTISCGWGGTITPTFSAAHAFAHAGLALGQTVLEALAINKGLKYLGPMFKQYGLKAGLGYFGVNYIINELTDKYVTKKAAKASNSYLRDALWGMDPEPEPQTVNHVEDIKDRINYSLDDKGKNTNRMNDVWNTESNTERQRNQGAEAARQAEIDRTNRQTNTDYNREIQQENTRINQDRNQAQRDYRDLYREQARQEGLRGRSVEREATRQGRQSAARDASRRKEQARIEAENRRQAALREGRNRANQSADDYRNNNPARTSLFKNMFKSALVSVVEGVLTDVGFAQGHNAIDYYLGDKDKNAKGAGVNVVALYQ